MLEHKPATCELQLVRTRDGTGNEEVDRAPCFCTWICLGKHGIWGQGGEDADWRMDLGEQIRALRRVKMLASKARDR